MSSQQRISTRGLSVAGALKRFVDDEVLPETPVTPDRFWEGFADLLDRFGDRNRELLEERTRIQSLIDQWHRDRRGRAHDPDEYEGFLREVGYLVDEGPDFRIDTENVDTEFASIPGPQLVVPVSNARYAINAANARWGSLYDALYGTDAIGSSPPGGSYDPGRGQQVISWARDFLDDVAPLADASHHDVTAYRVADRSLEVGLRDGSVTGLASPDRFVGFTGEPQEPTAVLLRNHNLAVELTIDRDHPIGGTDGAGVADILLESAISVIMDLEDSVAAVDADDKVAAYRNWLGLLRGDLNTRVLKGGDDFVRQMSEDRSYRTVDEGTVTLPGQAMMLVRNVGLLMTTDCVLDSDGKPIPEGLLDAMVSVACGLHDIHGLGRLSNSRTGSIYLVKPKLHGPDEVTFTDAVLHHVEATLGLAANTVKLGIMDEERRTSVNLKECIRPARSRVAFINTGFLDRTGDEIHTSMEAGPMVRKLDMKSQRWMPAYEDRNVDIGLACGLPGRAQIGKGMWAAPDRMAAMLEEKFDHPRAGATCAWVPSPTAATLHATHYHRIDVLARQEELAGQVRASLGDLLSIPLASETDWTEPERVAELENNAQGILGYVVRWIDQGVGCSKVPDINGIALMEDRATCRISSQHIANWLRHGLTDEDEVTAVMQRMAAVVDEQNADDPLYVPMAPDYDGLAFEAALRLVLEGAGQPSGYTEPILHELRERRKRDSPGDAT